MTDYGCRDYLGGCGDWDTAGNAGNPPIPVLSGPGQAAADAYNAQVPTYSGGQSIAWAVSPDPAYNILGQSVPSGTDPLAAAADVAAQYQQQQVALVAAAEAVQPMIAGTSPSGLLVIMVIAALFLWKVIK